MTSFYNVKVQSYRYISVAPQFLSYVLLPIFQLVVAVSHRLGVVVCLEKRLDVDHGLLNVLTEAVRVLRVQKRRGWVGGGGGLSWSRKTTPSRSGALTV